MERMQQDGNKIALGMTVVIIFAIVSVVVVFIAFIIILSLCLSTGGSLHLKYWAGTLMQKNPGIIEW